MRSLIIMIFILGSQMLRAKEFMSTTDKVHLIELYSTQSCSSCPPAQERVNKFLGHPGLYKKFIPIVFHVDYWDYLGWKDPFSKTEFSKRQRSYAASWGSSRVYTPMFILDGKESGRKLEVKAKEKAGTLKTMVLKDEIKVSYEGGKKEARFVNIALIGNEIITKVKSGENRGKDLKQNFLVLSHKRIPFEKGKATIPSEMLSGFDEYQNSIVVWVEDGKRNVLQTVGGKL